MAHLISKVLEETMAQEYCTFITYMQESELEEELEFYRKVWNGTLRPVGDVIQTITIIEGDLITFRSKVAKALFSILG